MAPWLPKARCCRTCFVPGRRWITIISRPPRAWGASGLRLKSCLCLTLIQASQADALATAVTYIAWSVVKDMPEGARVLVTGGGAWNPTLMAALERQGEEKNLDWDVPQKELVEGKEAMVFAWLGLLRWLGIDNTLSSVTGAERDSSGGALWGQGAL